MRIRGVVYKSLMMIIVPVLTMFILYLLLDRVPLRFARDIPDQEIPLGPVQPGYSVLICRHTQTTVPWEVLGNDRGVFPDGSIREYIEIEGFPHKYLSDELIVYARPLNVFIVRGEVYEIDYYGTRIKKMRLDSWDIAGPVHRGDEVVRLFPSRSYMTLFDYKWRT